MELRALADEAVGQATGRAHRDDPVLAGTGGPAGNARLTAWTGMVLLVLFVAELVTLLDVQGLVSWHVAIGVLLVPPALVKTASTGWRILRYYTGHRPYRQAGPPPLVLRLLGPVVVVTTLAVLVSGLVLVLLGPDGSRRPLPLRFGQTLDAVMIHKAAFLLWAAATGVHALARLVPALQIVGGRGQAPRPVPGGFGRGATLVAAIVAGVVVAGLAIPAASAWRSAEEHGRVHRHVVSR